MKKILKDKKLTKEQADTVKEMIISSMRNVYTDRGSLPSDDFDRSSGAIADRIVHNVQMALVQNSVFEKAIQVSKPKKVVKKGKK